MADAKAWAACQFERGRLVPPYELRELQLAPALVATVPARQTSQALALLTRTLPDASPRHLKRARPGVGGHVDIIVTLLEAAHATTAQVGDDAAAAPDTVHAAAATAESFLPEAATPMRELASGWRVVHVPAHAPQSRAQWDAWNGRYWALAPWKQPALGAPLGGGKPIVADADGQVLLSDADQAYAEAHVTALLQALEAKAHPPDARAGECCGSGVGNAARIVDPATGEVVGVGMDARDTHPLSHAVMLAVARVAERDFTLWPLSQQQVPPQHGSVDAVGVRGSGCGDDVCDDVCDDGEPAKRPRLQAPCAACDGDLGSREARRKAHVHAADCTAGREGAGSVSRRVVPASAEKPYMCTGYDAFLLAEPCMMCAMALVHSRVARVFYGVRDPVGGALGGRCMLMQNRSLNHHYLVFHVPLRQAGRDSC